MSPLIVKYVLDIITLLLGFYIVGQIFKSSIAGTIGNAFRLILIGIFVLAINHLLDTAFLADTLKMAGHTADFLQSAIVHRAINLIGFLIITIGFKGLNKTPSL